MSLFLSKHPLNSYLKLPMLIPCPPKPKPFGNFLIRASLPARDRVIDFGKYKGKMLGTLPSTYLKWVSTNLKARDFEEWAQLADQVLEDPVYNDRIEWEYANRLLSGNVLPAKSMSLGKVDELLEISQRFGWDNEDKVGWSKIDFQMLGTSKGGRIPRVKERRDSDNWDGEVNKSKREGKVSVSETRIERRARLRMRGNARNVEESQRVYTISEYEGRRSGVRSNGGEGDVYNPFPGRETLLQKVLNRRKIG